MVLIPVCLSTGEPVDNQQHPDYVPSLNLPVGQNAGNLVQKLDRFRRVVARREKRKLIDSDSSDRENVDASEKEEVESIDFSCQVNMDPQGISLRGWLCSMF